MDDKGAYFKIGVFVMASVAILVGTVVLLGASELTRETITLETYVDESVQGLTKGAPLKFRGVEIGKVDWIGFVGHVYDTEKTYIMLRVVCYADRLLDRRHENMERNIGEGLRVRIASAGITGAMYLEVDYLDPKENPVLPIDWTPEFPHLPSTKSTMKRFTDRAEDILKSLENAKIDVLAQNANGMIEDVRAVVNGDLAESMSHINEAAALLPGVLQDARDSLVDDLAGEVKETLDSIESAFRGEFATAATHFDEAIVTLSVDVHKLLVALNDTVDGDVGPALANINRATESLPETITRLNRTLLRVERMLSNQDENVGDTLANLRRVSADLKLITDSARRQPSRLLFGKAPPQREK